MILELFVIYYFYSSFPQKETLYKIMYIGVALRRTYMNLECIIMGDIPVEIKCLRMSTTSNRYLIYVASYQTHNN